jgi:two-component system phosphate regulon sensor histidine kinase PhoR
MTAPTDEAARERYMQIVMDETLRLEAIVGDLLDLARLEGHGAQLDLDDVPVGRLFARAIERHGAAMTDKHIRCDTAVSPDATFVDGDARRLEQAIQNLVANAVRHTPEGGAIELSASRDDGHVRLRVRDSGPGIPPEHLPHVFDRFYRVDAARGTATGGSGLGLTIVKAIAEAHAGSVSVTNADDGGACFDLWLLSARSTPPGV